MCQMLRIPRNEDVQAKRSLQFNVLGKTYMHWLAQVECMYGILGFPKQSVSPNVAWGHIHQWADRTKYALTTAVLQAKN